MSESMLLSVAIFVFLMMAIGLGLTVWEFHSGQPRRQDDEAMRGKRRSQPSRLVDSA